MKYLMSLLITGIFATNILAQVPNNNNSSSKAQSSWTSYEPGYIIKQNNDTVFGQVKVLNDLKRHRKVILKTESGQAKYYPDGIKGYQFRNSRYISYNGRFLEQLAEGKISLYVNRRSQTMPGGGGYGYATTVTEYYLTKNGIPILFDDWSFNKQFSQVYSDHPDWVETVNNLPKKISVTEVVRIINSKK